MFEPDANFAYYRIYEIINEEEEFMKQLKLAYTEPETLSEKTDEQKWIGILARRAVFIEEVNGKTIKENSPHKA